MQALQHIQSEQFFVVNGDTLFDVELESMGQFHKSKKADLTIALKPMEQFDRYGLVKIDRDAKITGFEEKNYRENGLINGGVYLMNTTVLKTLDLPDKFSFEKDFLEVFFEKLNLYGFTRDRYFIDIGIPEDYRRACEELAHYQSK